MDLHFSITMITLAQAYVTGEGELETTEQKSWCGGSCTTRTKSLLKNKDVCVISLWGPQRCFILGLGRGASERASTVQAHAEVSDLDGD